MIKKFITFQILITFLAYSVLYLLGFEKNLLYSMFFSSILSCVNVALFIWAMNKIFLKKSIALAVSVIVFKWLILLVLIYEFTQWPDASQVGLIVGLNFFLPALIIASYLSHKKKGKNGTF